MSRIPLVYASRRAVEEAATIVPGEIIENLVSHAIVAGDVRFGNGHGTVTGDRWRASVRRSEPRVRARKHPRAWLVLAVEAAPTTEREEQSVASHEALRAEPDERAELELDGWEDPTDSADDEVAPWVGDLLPARRRTEDEERF